MTAPSEARVFLGPGGRNTGPHDDPDTVSFYFPFAVSDAILIFTNIVVPGPDPFSVSEESRREVFWPLIKRITNYPKAVDPILANGSMEIGDQVEALMESLDNAFTSGVKNVYINCAGTLVGVSASLMHQFLELSEKVFHLWKNRNDAARPEDSTNQPAAGNIAPTSSSSSAQTQSAKASPTPQTTIQTRSSLSDSKTRVSVSSSSRAVEQETPIRPLRSASTNSGMASSSSNQGNGNQGSRDLVSPFNGNGDPETPAARQARIDEHTLQQQLLASHAQTLAAQSQQSQQHLSESDMAYQSATSQWLSSGAGKVPISEIWRATIYRLYNEQNESLTKYRRPNWLFHLESHQVRTIEDLGGWREDDESTRQLANNLITKLQETGYGTKGLQSRLKAITTSDIREAILNVERGGLEKYRPGPTLGKRVTPIKWSHLGPIPGGPNGSMMEMDSPTNSPAPQPPYGSTPEVGGTVNDGDSTTLKRSTESSAHPIRIKRKRTSSPVRESLTLLIPAEMSDDKTVPPNVRRETPSAIAPVAPMMRPESTPQTGFTPININRSAVPAVSSVSKFPTPAPIAPAPPLAPTPVIAPTPTPVPIAPVPATLATPTPNPANFRLSTAATPATIATQATFTTPPTFTTPASSTKILDIRAFADTTHRSGTPEDTIDLESEPDEDDANMMDELVFRRLQYLKRGLDALRQELAESKQVDNASIVENAAREAFDNFAGGIQDSYHNLWNLARSSKERIDRLEANAGLGGNGSIAQEQLAEIEARITANITALVDIKIAECNSQLTDKITAMEAKIIQQINHAKGQVVKDSDDEAELNRRMSALDEKLKVLEGDTNARFEMLENPAPAPVVTSTRRATRNSISAPTPPVAVLTTETRLRLDKLEARLEKAEAGQRKVGTANNLSGAERLGALEDKLKGLEGSLNQVMEAVSGLLIQVMKEKRNSIYETGGKNPETA
ncbi:hypothetical protein TWF730_002031 [Orbilia blumenaviensis]|uniref:Uncharacterized protein n=1 Tax=Orbilia blumenaviensis TaxID=1796055 RepID=A0AAV9UG88_9PEZI